MKALALLCLVASTALAQTDAQVIRYRDLYVTSGSAPSVLPTALQYQGSATTYYVRTDGSDLHACKTNTAAGACLTIQGAVNKIPKNIGVPVIVQVGAGSFTGAVMGGFKFQTSNANAGTLALKGTMINFTPATGTATGTATAATDPTPFAAGTLTDSTQSWTTDNLKGQLLQVTQTSGVNGQGNTCSVSVPCVMTRMIGANTSTAITLAGGWVQSTQAAGIIPTAGAAYVVQDWATSINVGLPTAQKEYDNMGGALLNTAIRFGFQWYNGTGGGNLASVEIVDGFRFTGAVQDINIFAVGVGNFFIIRSRFDGSLIAGGQAIQITDMAQQSIAFNSGSTPAGLSFVVSVPRAATFVQVSENVLSGSRVISNGGTTFSTMGTFLARGNILNMTSNGAVFGSNALNAYYIGNKVDCNGVAGVNAFASTGQTRQIGQWFFSGNTVQNCNVGVLLSGPGNSMITSSGANPAPAAANTFGNNSVAISVSQGATAEVQLADYLGDDGGTVLADGGYRTDFLLDSIAYSATQLRLTNALAPDAGGMKKSIMNLNNGSTIYEVN